MREFKIFLFRHGQTSYNRDKRFTGWHDPSLTGLGKKNARKIGVLLKDKEIEIGIHTRLKRSKQTLNEVLKYHPECKRLIKDDRMIERNYGKLNGTSHEAFIKNIGKRLYKLEVEGDLITALDKDGRKKVERFLGEQEYNLIHRGYDIPPPGGESFRDVEKRVGKFIKDLIKLIKKEKKNVAISAHGNSIRLFRKIMENASVEESVKWVIPYDKVFTYKVKV